jgi:uncharacterized membrane protein YccF (DUF307 family)
MKSVPEKNPFFVGLVNAALLSAAFWFLVIGGWLCLS